MNHNPRYTIVPDQAADEPQLMMDINTTPLIDVMLVLLVMLIITIPIQLHAVNLNLPLGHVPASQVRPQRIQIDIDALGVVYWQGQPMDAQQLDANLAAVAGLAQQPELHLRTDKNAQYAVFVAVLAASRRNGLSQVAVVGSEQFAP